MTEPIRFVTRGLPVALAGIGVILLLGAFGAGLPLRWTVAGWAVPAVLHLAGGAWMALRYGSPAAGFVLAAGAGFLTRLAAISLGLALAAGAGGDPLAGYLVGVALGFVPLTAFEMIWFYRLGRASESRAR